MALNDKGGVEDDIIVWYLDADRFWVMPNGTNSDEIVSRFRLAAPSSVRVADVRSESVLFAVQGPTASDVFAAVLGVVPGRFRVIDAEFEDTSVVAAGTGYTGEPGGEICAPAAVGAALWDALVNAGATPCGLGARDTLRLEMGYPLWGQDLDADTTPFQASLGWVVSWDHEFVGKRALEASRDEPGKSLIAFTTEGRAIPRHGYPFRSATGSGHVTSGNFSPTLGHGIGMASVTPPPGPDEDLVVEIRGKDVVATRTTVPFVTR
jgi:aminomethyltransferase